ncbi:hypothetical protein KJ359_012443 [Pestalotiopsis sp. 9143b]|nr:hypothetical protein KJ359_012443 [Pestalotiopsis sp. 9143b]
MGRSREARRRRARAQHDRRRALRSLRRDRDSENVGFPLPIRQGPPEQSYDPRDNGRDDLDDESLRSLSELTLQDQGDNHSRNSSKYIDQYTADHQEYQQDEYQLRAARNLARAANSSFDNPNCIPVSNCRFSGNRPPSPYPYTPQWDSYVDEAPGQQYQDQVNFNDPDTNYSLRDSDHQGEARDSFHHSPTAPFSSQDTLIPQQAPAASSPAKCDKDQQSDDEPLIPLKTALATLKPWQPAFWSILNVENWTKDPEYVRSEKKRKAKEARDAMADPFEVRMRFSGQLQHLNASVVSAQKAAQYAMKHKDMSEDLHSCILEQLEKTSMNTRANIMYFIEPFLELAEKERVGNDYIRMMQRDIIRVVDAVCPEDGSGAANVKVVRKVLRGLMSKGFLLEQVVDELEECLKDRAAASHADMGFSSPIDSTLDAGANNAGVAATVAASDATAPKAKPAKLEKRQIEQRIEEDRERHKKMRENMWVTPKDQEEKLRKLWDETSELGEDDERLAQEEEDECVELTGTGIGQAERRREYLANEEAKKNRRDQTQNGFSTDADGDVRMNGDRSR